MFQGEVEERQELALVCEITWILGDYLPIAWPRGAAQEEEEDIMGWQ